MSTVRLKRLNADFNNLTEYLRRHPRLRLIQADGDPPERYQLEYRIRSLRQVDGELKEIKKHIVEIALPRNYPRTPPQCRMLSPVFHPNIAPHAICVGDHWSAGESLQSIVLRIGEMLAYQVYNVKSPLNGEAARWVQQHEDDLPLDPVSLLVEEAPAQKSRGEKTPTERPRRRPVAMEETVPAQRRPGTTTSPSGGPRKSRSEPAVPVAAAAEPDTEKIVVRCTECSRRYRVPRKMIGRTAACQSCGAEFSIQPDGE